MCILKHHMLIISVCNFMSVCLSVYLHTLCFETRSLYVTLAVLDLDVDQAGPELMEIHLPLPLERWDKKMCTPRLAL